jgi:hypothetical protein
LLTTTEEFTIWEVWDWQQLTVGRLVPTIPEGTSEWGGYEADLKVLCPLFVCLFVVYSHLSNFSAILQLTLLRWRKSNCNFIQRKILFVTKLKYNTNCFFYFWVSLTALSEPTLFRTSGKPSFACQGDCDPWHGAPTDILRPLEKSENLSIVETDELKLHWLKSVDLKDIGLLEIFPLGEEINTDLYDSVPLGNETLTSNYIQLLPRNKETPFQQKVNN